MFHLRKLKRKSVGGGVVLFIIQSENDFLIRLMTSHELLAIYYYCRKFFCLAVVANVRRLGLKTYLRPSSMNYKECSLEL